MADPNRDHSRVSMGARTEFVTFRSDIFSRPENLCRGLLLMHFFEFEQSDVIATAVVT